MRIRTQFDRNNIFSDIINITSTDLRQKYSHLFMFLNKENISSLMKSVFS